MGDDNRDIATVFPDEYSRSAPFVLGDQHKFLLETLEKHLAGRQSPALLVLGSGGQVLPYSCSYTPDGKLGGTNRDRIKKMLGNGKMVLLDYVSEYDRSGLIKGLDTLTQMGFIEPKYFHVGSFVNEGYICPLHTKPGTISFIRNDLRENLKISGESVDAVDANLSIHHASVTRADLERIYREIYSVLKPGGMLHLGEGNVDMNYTEDKLVRIGQDIADLNKRAVFFSDLRNVRAGQKMRALFEPGKKYDCLPAVQDARHYSSTMLVSENGDVILQTMEDSEIVAKKLKEKGYGTVEPLGRTTIKMPLIDHWMREDVYNYIRPVQAYYAAITDRVVQGYSGKDDTLVSKVIEAVDDECENAVKGIVEHYMGESRIIAALKKAGFNDIKVHRVSEPFYNITAVK